LGEDKSISVNRSCGIFLDAASTNGISADMAADYIFIGDKVFRTSGTLGMIQENFRFMEK
jgi:hypothetical protein